MVITGSIIQAFIVCSRQAWLIAHQICPFEENDNLLIGRNISKESYNREKKEIIVDNNKIDIIKEEGNKLIISEIKKSTKFLEAGEMQLIYYLYKLKQKGINAIGELVVPKEKFKKTIILDPLLENKILEIMKEIYKIIDMKFPPKVKKSKLCKNCSYKEFCYA